MGSDKGKELHMQHDIKSAMCSEYLSNPAGWSKWHVWAVMASQLDVSENDLAKNLALLLLWKVLTGRIMEYEQTFKKEEQTGHWFNQKRLANEIV